MFLLILKGLRENIKNSQLCYYSLVTYIANMVEAKKVTTVEYNIDDK